MHIYSLISIFAVLTVSQVSAYKKAIDLPDNAIPDIIKGYMDGLLGVKFDKQMVNCEIFLHNAADNFNDAIDDFY